MKLGRNSRDRDIDRQAKEMTLGTPIRGPRQEQRSPPPRARLPSILRASLKRLRPRPGDTPPDDATACLVRVKRRAGAAFGFVPPLLFTSTLLALWAPAAPLALPVNSPEGEPSPALPECATQHNCRAMPAFPRHLFRAEEPRWPRYGPHSPYPAVSRRSGRPSQDRQHMSRTTHRLAADHRHFMGNPASPHGLRRRLRGCHPVL